MNETDDRDDLGGAQGKVVVFLAALLQRSNIVSPVEFGQLLAVFADCGGPRGEILSRWATAVKAMAPN